MRLTALGAPWMSTRTRILREYRAAEEWVEAARANRIGLFRVIAGRKPGAHLTPTSSTYGGASTHGLGLTMCAFTTYDTAGRRELWRSARACL